MPFPVYAAMLSSQLIVLIADRVPQIDVGPSCRESTVHDCLSTEKLAREKLVEAWPRFTAQDKATCVMEERLAGPPSYVGWLTCLQINANARNALATTPGDGTGAKTRRVTRGGTSSGIRRRHTKHRFVARRHARSESAASPIRTTPHIIQPRDGKDVFAPDAAGARRIRLPVGALSRRDRCGR
jgi:hypothetical protein